jgi:hypothetical protein
MGAVRNFLENCLSSLFFFLALLLYGEEAGLYFSSLNKLGGSIFLFLYVLSLRIRISGEGKWLLRAGGVIVIYILMLMSPTPIISVGLALLIPLLANQQKRHQVFRIGLVFFIYLVSRSFIPQFCLIEQSIADNFNYGKSNRSSWRSPEI